jgi:hypothetical protein
MVTHAIKVRIMFDVWYIEQWNTRSWLAEWVQSFSNVLSTLQYVGWNSAFQRDDTHIDHVSIHRANIHINPYLIRCVHVCTMFQQMFNDVNMSIPGCPKQSLKQNFTYNSFVCGITTLIYYAVINLRGVSTNKIIMFYRHANIQRT